MATARDMVTRALRVGEGRKFKAYEKRAAAIGEFEPEMELLGDDELRVEADALRERARNGESLDDLLPEAFALTREAGRRTLGQRHFDVQLVGGMVLHDGAIAEMKTGEGKTLTATLAVFLNTLAGDSVHLVTVNDYLARRDAEWMKPIYDALGVTVGAIQDSDDHAARQRKYACDVTYGTNSEFGFDYLRDNMADAARALRAARPPLRDRRRGRQHPHRRGADAADHLRRPRTGSPDLLPVRPPGTTDERASRRKTSCARWASRRTPQRPTTTTNSTRSTRPSLRPSAA